MSTFEVKVRKLEPGSVTDHPDADRLSLIKIMDYVAISAKLEDGSHRYSEGDLVVYVPEGAVVPDYLLKPGFWNDEKNMGILSGPKGNRVKAMRLRGIFSQGILFGVEHNMQYFLTVADGSKVEVFEGQDVAELLGIEKYSPPIPPALAGEVCNIHGKTVKYDFDSIQTLTDLFAEGEEVVVTEKLHGCLHGDSLVMLPNGEEVPIRDVVNDLSITTVLSYDIENNKYISRKITGRKDRKNIENKKWVKLSLKNGRILILTADHPVYSRDAKMWIEAGKIRENEDIESPRPRAAFAGPWSAI
jgi:RNA ligase (TIGR02306 family)